MYLKEGRGRMGGVLTARVGGRGSCWLVVMHESLEVTIAKADTALVLWG